MNIVPNIQILINILNTCPNTDSLHLLNILFNCLKLWYWKNNLMAHLWVLQYLSVMWLSFQSVYLSYLPPLRTERLERLQAISVGNLSFTWLFPITGRFILLSMCRIAKSLNSWTPISLLCKVGGKIRQRKI